MMNTTKLKWAVGLSLAVSASSALAQTTPVVSDLGATQTTGSTIYGAGPPAEYAQEFVTGSQNFQLADVVALLGAGSTSATYTASAELVSNNGGTPGSTVLGSFNSLSSVPTAYTQELFTPTSTVELAANTDYWLIISGSSTATSPLFKWGYTNTTSASLPQYDKSTNNGSTWTAGTGGPFVLQVDAVTSSLSSPVPLPATVWLMLSGIGGFGFLARRRRA